MASLAPVIKQRYFDSSGDPLVGGKLFSYVAGSSTPLATYTDKSASTPNTNPVILDANGEADVWLSDNYYKIVLTDSNDVIQWTVDNIAGTGFSGLSDSTGLITSGPFPLTNGQAATDLSGEVLSGSTWRAAHYLYNIRRGTTVMATGQFSLHYKNSVWSIELDGFSGDVHGATFSVSQVGEIAQLKIALNSGAGDGEIIIKKFRYEA
jgi:hypothetical protein